MASITCNTLYAALSPGRVDLWDRGYGGFGGREPGFYTRLFSMSSYLQGFRYAKFPETELPLSQIFGN
jgi:hypothetical protein